MAQRTEGNDVTVRHEGPVWDFDEWEDDTDDADLLTYDSARIPDREMLGGLPAKERTRLIDAFVRQEIARVLRVAPEAVETSGRTMSALGVGSVAGMQIQRRLEAVLDVEVNLQMLLLANSAGELIDCLAKQLGHGDATRSRQNRRPA